MATIVVKDGNAADKYYEVSGAGTSGDPHISNHIIRTNSAEVDVNNPLPTDGDSVYTKDIWADQCITTGWADTDSTGLDLAFIPFTNLHTRITYSGTTNPKVLEIHFERTVQSHQVGIGSYGGGDFSNLKIELLGSGDTVREAVDESTSDTKYTSRDYPFEPAKFNAVRLSFYTEDDVAISNITLQKSRNVSAQIQGIRSDGLIGTVNLTNGNNLKTSIEEFESGVSSDSNTKLNTAPFLVDEYGNYANLLSDNIFKGALITIPTEHHEIHCGDSYQTSFMYELSNAEVLDVLIIVPNEGLSETNPGDSQSTKQYHFVGSAVFADGEGSVVLYESPTITSNGAALTVVNKNRNSSSTDYLTVYQGATISATGTYLDGARVGSGKTGGEVNRTDEWILKDNTTYLLRFSNHTTISNWLTSKINYYVHPGV